jgi:glyoxylase-like metal-dependent hydrolase (beta-lactamase superfamily II)
MSEGLSAPVQVAPDLWRVSTPLPFRPREVHAALARLDGGRWMLVDGGLGTDDAWAALDACVRSLAGGWDAVALHAVTHMHVDHVGLAARVREACGARVLMGALDAERMAHAAAEPGEEAEYRATLFRQAGIPAEVVAKLEGAREQQSAATPYVPVDDALAGDGGELPGAPGWRWTWTPGHTAGHVAFFRDRDRVLIAGDAILPRLLPTIGVNRQREDPVGDALSMLERVAALEPRTVVGGHGDVIGDPAARIAELRAGYEDEGRTFAGLLSASPRTAWELAEARRPGRELPDVIRVQLTREALAHLQRLRAAGIARTDTLDSGAAGWTLA